MTCLLTIRCYQRRPVLESAARDHCVQSLLWLQRNRDVLLHAFVVMPSHVHVIVTLPADQLSRLLHSFKSFTANEANKALRRSGPLWDEGARDDILWTDKAVEDAATYVENNPVRAELADSPEQYQWSSA